MEDRSSRRLRTLVTHWPVRGLSGNENARALISMMARSTNRSNQRPDTLMQDRKAARSTKPLATRGRTIHWVKMRRTQGEKSESAPMTRRFLAGARNFADGPDSDLCTAANGHFGS